MPIFLFRHYVTDRGVFPEALHDDAHPFGDTRPVLSRARMLPCLALAGAMAAAVIGNLLAVT